MNKIETLVGKLNRLRSERGESASREAISAYKQQHGKQGMLSVQEQIRALESFSAIKQAPLSSTTVSQVQQMTSPSVGQPSGEKSDVQPELTSRALLEDSIKKTLNAQGLGGYVPDSAKSRVPALEELHGRDLVEASIQDQLRKSGLAN